MKISFCVTYHNQEEFIWDSLGSILKLNIPIDYEILILDDNSTDNSCNIIKYIKKTYDVNIKLFKIKGNGKNLIERISFNRIFLAKRAKGNFIMFLDGDDFYCNYNFIYKAIEAFKNNSSISAVAFSYLLYKGNKFYTIKTLKNEKEKIITAKDYIKYKYIHSGAFIFKNIFNKEVIYNIEKYKNFDDNTITLFFLNYGDIYYIPIEIYAYRQLDTSTWNGKIYNSLDKEFLNVLDYLYLSSIMINFKKELFFRYYYSIKQIFIKRNILHEVLNQQLLHNFNNYRLYNKNNPLVNFLTNYYNNKIFNRIKIIIWFYLNKLFRRK